MLINLHSPLNSFVRVWYALEINQPIYAFILDAF